MFFFLLLFELNENEKNNELDIIDFLWTNKHWDFFQNELFLGELYL